MTELSPAKTALINSIAAAEGYTSFSITVKSGSLKGDGYMGIIHTVRITSNNNPKKSLNLVIKSAQSDAKLRQVAPIRKLYQREIFMYTTVFPALAAFQSQIPRLSARFAETPKCYGSLLADHEESLVLEDLRTVDFRLWNRKEPMDGAHIALVMETYGKFHGASLAMKELDREGYQRLASEMRNVFEDENGQRSKEFRSSLKMVLDNGFRAVKDNAEGTKALQRFQETSVDFFESQLSVKNKFTCFVHGDCWCNNMLFRYKDGKPVDMRFLDFQISYAGSPVVDLSYYLYTATSGSRQTLNDLDKYLRIYHASLARVVNESGCDANKIMTFDELMGQWKLLSRFGLFMSIIVVKIMLGDADDVPDLTQSTGTDLISSLAAANTTKTEEADKRIAEIIDFMAEREFL